MQPIKSPFQNIRKPAQKPVVMDLTTLWQKMTQLDNAISSVEDLKKELKQEHEKTLSEMRKEHAGEIGRIRKLQTINKGEPGVSPDKEEIVQAVLSKIPKPEDGKTPVIDTLEIAKAAAKFVKVPEPVTPVVQIDHQKVADEVLGIIEKGKKKLSTKHIGDFKEGMEQHLRPIRSLALGFRGGGDTVTAGTNITITTDVNGKKVITSTGGASATIYSETPTGAINGSNKVYTTAHTVTTVIGFWINGQFIHPSEYSVVGTTITFVTALDATLSGTGFTISYT